MQPHLNISRSLENSVLVTIISFNDIMHLLWRQNVRCRNNQTLWYTLMAVYSCAKKKIFSPFSPRYPGICSGQCDRLCQKKFSIFIKRYPCIVQANTIVCSYDIKEHFVHVVFIRQKSKWVTINSKVLVGIATYKLYELVKNPPVR